MRKREKNAIRRGQTKQGIETSRQIGKNLYYFVTGFGDLPLEKKLCIGGKEKKSKVL